MEDKKDEIIIPYLRYVSYNQLQAEELGLNHTEAILMSYYAYYLPNYGISKIIWKKNYYWLNLNKLFSDLPTLKFKEATLRKNINKLIKEWLLERKICGEVWKQRAFYRATDEFLIKRNWPPLNFGIVYSNINILLEEGRLNSTDKNKLEKLLSSYKGKKIINKTTFNLSWIEWSPILDYLRKEFELSIKWEWVEINVWVEINEDYVIKNIFDKIKENGKDYGWIDAWLKWDYPLTDEIKGKILWNLKKMFQWLKDKKRPIKNFKSVINTWFGRSWI